MKIAQLFSIFSAALLAVAANGAGAMTVAAKTNANELAARIVGEGVSISNASLTLASDTAAGVFADSREAIGFADGVLLTTGSVLCAPGPNSTEVCSGSGHTTSLKFDFTSATGNIAFQYVFASEEYDEAVGSAFNDSFELLLNGTNIALLPGAGGVVSINNVNSTTNAAYFRGNISGAIDTQYDGLTTVLTASAFGLVGSNTFEFRVRDISDEVYDSAVFIPTGSFMDIPPVPEPHAYATLLLGLAAAGAMGWRRKAAQA